MISKRQRTAAAKLIANLIAVATTEDRIAMFAEIGSELRSKDQASTAELFEKIARMAELKHDKV